MSFSFIVAILQLVFPLVMLWLSIRQLDFVADFAVGCNSVPTQIRMCYCWLGLLLLNVTVLILRTPEYLTRIPNVPLG
jgi:hypothetical protein